MGLRVSLLLSTLTLSFSAFANQSWVATYVTCIDKIAPELVYFAPRLNIKDDSEESRQKTADLIIAIVRRGVEQGGADREARQALFSCRRSLDPYHSHVDRKLVRALDELLKLPILPSRSSIEDTPQAAVH